MRPLGLEGGGRGKMEGGRRKSREEGEVNVQREKINKIESYEKTKKKSTTLGELMMVCS